MTFMMDPANVVENRNHRIPAHIPKKSVGIILSYVTAAQLARENVIMMSNYTLHERSKILEWLIDDREITFLPYDDCGEGISYNTDELWQHIEKYREDWDK